MASDATPDLGGVFDNGSPGLLRLIMPEIGGGRISPAELEKIEGSPDATALMISGLDQSTFDVLVGRYGKQFRGISFWKCPRLEDLSPLEDLPGLEYVAFYWNQRATRLWDFRRTPRLRGLSFADFTRVHDLEDLRRATSLDELHCGNAVWPKWVIASLDPLESLPQLTKLRFDAKKIEDGRVEPLARLQRLTSLWLTSKQFSTRQFAWLRAHLPDSLESDSLEPVWHPSKPIGEGPFPRDTLVLGNGKPWLNSVRDAKRIEKYVTEFRAMVDEFRRHPEMGPD